MAGTVNKVILVGRVGADPEIRQAGDKDVANLRIATSESWKDKRSGEWQEKTEWHSITVWAEGTIKYIENNVSKGDLIYIEGQLETRKYEKDGVDHYKTDVVIPAFGGALKSLVKNDRDGGGDDRGSDRGGDRGGRSGGSRNDDRGANSRNSSRNDDRGSKDSGSDRGGRSNDRGNDRNDDRSSSRNSGSRNSGNGSSSRGGGKNDMDDDIPF
jgi:single-strand DNA-binding protein